MLNAQELLKQPVQQKSNMNFLDKEQMFGKL